MKQLWLILTNFWEHYKMEFFFLSLIISASSFAANIGYDACPLDSQTEKLCQVQKVGDRKEGKEICPESAGSKVILREAKFYRGKLEGEFICRNPTNHTEIRATYKNGKVEGELKDYSDKRYWKDIKKGWRVRYFHEDKQYGLEFLADEKGKVLDVMPGCWEKGDKDVTYYTRCLSYNYAEYDSQIKDYLNKEIQKRKADLNKSVEMKYGNGKTKLKATLVNGKYEGPYERFYENGQLQVKATYKKGFPEKEEEFYESGAKKRESRYVDGNVVENNEYYENGKIASAVKTKYDGLVRTEEVKRYSDRGPLSVEYTERYEESSYWGQYEGVYRDYNDDGKLVTEAFYIHGKLDGKFKYDNPESAYEEIWEKGVLKSKTILDPDTKSPREKIEYMKDGSEKSRTKL